MLKTVAWTILAFLAIGVGSYPVLYFLTDMSQGMLSSKPESVLNNIVWSFAFNLHIIGGGIALLIGWTQFSRKLRNTYLYIHRAIGKTYVISCTVGGIAALYLAFYATGGVISSLGFGSLAVLWLTTTSKAYFAIRNRSIDTHREWMVRSYALTFAAVTLRIWLPLLQFVVHMEFIPAYQLISWLCWVPNLIVAELIVRSQRRTAAPLLS